MCRDTGIDFEVFSTPEGKASRGVIERAGFPVATGKPKGEVIVTCVFHMNNYPFLLDYPAEKVIVLQHAWDTSLHLVKDFWTRNMGHFGTICVGGQQDYDFLAPVYGDSRIIPTGIAKFDVLYNLFKGKRGLQEPYGLATIPFAVDGEVVRWARFFDIRKEVEYPVYFKGHPQHDLRTLIQQHKDVEHWVWDNTEDEFDTYKWLVNAKFLYAVNSFFCIEAALVDIPVVFFGDLKAYEDPKHRQSERIPPDLGCNISNLSLTPGHEKVKSWYLFDGNNTKRIMDVIVSKLA